MRTEDGREKTMAEEKFELVSNYAPTGDQPQAIAQLVESDGVFR